MQLLKLLILSVGLQFSTTIKGQDNEILCTKGLSYGELISLFQITIADKLINGLQQKCFEEYHSRYSFFTTYERKYEKSDENSVTTYNELLTIKNGKAYEYKCSELAVCQRLLKKINDNAIYYCPSLADTNADIYILKDKLHVIEMRDIPDESIGYAYGFKYRAINSTDLIRLNSSKFKDNFPKTSAERSRLEYRYARIDSYDNPVTITINKGDKIHMEAGGEITLGYFAGKSSPDGIDGYTSYNKIQGFQHGCLLYTIGSSSWSNLNAEKEFVASNSGSLQFIVNDNDPSNNSGWFWVNIKIIRKQ